MKSQIEIVQSAYLAKHWFVAENLFIGRICEPENQSVGRICEPEI